MKIKTINNIKILEADKGKHIRSINDNYSKANEEHDEYFPTYATKIYLASNIDIDKINEIYIEEDIK